MSTGTAGNTRAQPSRNCLHQRSRPRASAREIALYNRTPSSDEEPDRQRGRGRVGQRPHGRNRDRGQTSRGGPHNDWYPRDNSPVTYPPIDTSYDDRHRRGSGWGRRQHDQRNVPEIRQEGHGVPRKEIDRKLVRMSNREEEHQSRPTEPTSDSAATGGHDRYDRNYKHGYTGIPDHCQYRSANEEYAYRETPPYNRFDIFQREGDWY